MTLKASEPLAPLQARACECPTPLVDDDTCAWCGCLLPGDPALELAATIAGTYPPAPRTTQRPRA